MSTLKCRHTKSESKSQEIHEFIYDYELISTDDTFTGNPEVNSSTLSYTSRIHHTEYLGGETFAI